MGWFKDQFGQNNFSLRRDDAPPARSSGRLTPGVRGAGTFQNDLVDSADDDDESSVDDLDDRQSGEDGDPDSESEDEDTPVFTRTMYEFERRNLSLGSAPKDQKSEDLVLAYQSKPSPTTLAPVLAFHGKFLERQISNHSNARIPKPAIRANVYNAFEKDIRKWSPEGGANVTTYYMNHGHLNLKREFRSYAQFGKANRDRVSKIERIQNVATRLEDEGVDATAERIAQATNFSLKDVRLALTESSNDLLGSKDLGESVSSDSQMRMAASRIKDYYSPTNAKIVDRIFGLDGKPPDDDNQRIAAAVGATYTHVSAQKAKIRKDLVAELQRMGA